MVDESIGSLEEISDQTPPYDLDPEIPPVENSYPKPESKPLPPEEDIVPDIITPSLTNYTFNEVTGEIFFTFYFKLFGLVRYIFFLISKNIGRIERKIIARIIGKR